MTAILRIALASTILSSTTAMVGAQDFFFRVEGGMVASNPGTGPGTGPDTDTDPETNPGTGPEVGTGPGPTWGYCGTSLVLTPYTADCNGDGTPNMTERPDGSLVDSDPNDGWEAIYTDEEKDAYEALKEEEEDAGRGGLVFLPVTTTSTQPYTYSNVARYGGPSASSPTNALSLWTMFGQHNNPPLEFVRCQTPSGCDESAQWSSADPTVLNTGDYVRLRVGRLNRTGEFVTWVDVDDISYVWSLTSTRPDSDGDGFPDDIDPEPHNPLIPPPPVASVPAQHWRILFSNFMHAGHDEPADPSLPYHFSEIKVTFEGGGSTNQSDTPAVQVRTYPNPSGNNLVDDNHDTEWTMPAPDAGYVAFTVPSGRKAVSYSWTAGETWTHAARYTVNIELQSSQDGQNWTTHDRQFNAQIGYSDGETYQVRQN